MPARTKNADQRLEELDLAWSGLTGLCLALCSACGGGYTSTNENQPAQLSSDMLIMIVLLCSTQETLSPSVV